MDTATTPATPPLIKPKETATVHPAIGASVYCLIVYTVAVVVGLILNHKTPGLGVVCSVFASPFIVAAMLCAIYGMCKGQIKYGMLLLGGVSSLMALSFGTVIMSVVQSAVTGSGDIPQQAQDLQKQLGQMLQQLNQ